MEKQARPKSNRTSTDHANPEKVECPQEKATYLRMWEAPGGLKKPRRQETL